MESKGEFEDAVYIYTDPVVPDAVGEEVVIDPAGGSSESVLHYQEQDEDGIISELEAGSFVEVKEEELSYDDGSEEMSVAIDLAKLSQGHFPSRGDSLNLHRKLSSDSGCDTQYVFYTEDGREAQCLEDIEGRTVHVADMHSKPRMSYAQLIAEALMSASSGMLTLAEIYQAISSKHPFYKLGERNWQNSIRHNLTLNKSFSKVARSQGNEGRGSFWKLEPGAEAAIFKWKARQAHKNSRTSFPSLAVESEEQVVEEEIATTTIMTDSQNPDQIIYVTIPSN